MLNSAPAAIKAFQNLTNQEKGRGLPSDGTPDFATRQALVEAYMREQGLFHDSHTPEASYTDLLTLDLATIEPSLAGPKRPQDRVRLGDVKAGFEKELPTLVPKPAAVKGASTAAALSSGVMMCRAD